MGQHESSDPKPESVATDTAAALRFVIRALVWMALLYAAYYFPYEPTGLPGRLLQRYLELQAQASAFVVALFEPGAGASGVVITGRFPLEIVRTCSSLDAQALYAGAVLAYPLRGGSRLKRTLTHAIGIVVGVLALTLLNILRIAVLYFVGADAPGMFDAVHEELLPLVLVACAGLGFAFWASKARSA